MRLGGTASPKNRMSPSFLSSPMGLSLQQLNLYSDFEATKSVTNEFSVNLFRFWWAHNGSLCNKCTNIIYGVVIASENLSLQTFIPWKPTLLFFWFWAFKPKKICMQKIPLPHLLSQPGVPHESWSVHLVRFLMYDLLYYLQNNYKPH